MKIGFITTHQYQNFGTFLQCYALQQVLKKLGHEVEIIDYQRKDLNRSTIERTRILLGDIIRNLKEYLFFLKNYSRIRKRNILFIRFARDNFKLSRQCYATAKDLEINPPQYDLYLSGSDQIWNPSLSGIIKPYFLTFAPKSSTKASYAPSIGISSLSNKQCKEMYEYLISYKHISCREFTGVKLLESCGLNDIKHVLDPTFLLSVKEWIAITKDIKSKKTNYNLTYFLDYSEDKKSIAQQALIDNQIIDLTDNFKRCNNSIIEAGPLEFISLIQHANIVCTDSYHGMIFALIFEKEFYILPRHSVLSERSQNSRIQDLLCVLGIPERWITKDFYPAKKINYSQVSLKLDELREKSISYLMSITHD